MTEPQGFSGFFRSTARPQNGPHALRRARLLARQAADFLADGAAAEALGHCEEALRLRQAVLQPPHPELADSLNDCGVAAWAVGRLGRAARHLSLALDMRQRLAGDRPDRPEVAQTLVNLARVRIAEGQFAEAERLLRSAAGPEGLPATVRAELALAIHAQGRRDDEARALYEQAADALADRPVAAGRCWNNLAALLARQGEMAEAAGAYTRAAAAYRSAFPHGHPELAVCLEHHGEMLWSNGQHEEASNLVTEAVTLRERLLPAGHPDRHRGRELLDRLRGGGWRARVAVSVTRQTPAIGVPAGNEPTATHGQASAAAEPPRDEEPPVRPPGFRGFRRLGAGGMGEVFAAEEVATGGVVAVKFIRRDQVSAEGWTRFQREARILGRVTHPNVVPFHSAGELGGTPYLVMPLLQGETLSARLRHGPLPLAEAVRIGAEVGGALEAVHAAGVMHRDVKPGNVWVAPDGRVLLFDFGLAKSAGDDLLTLPGQYLGTPGFVAPEQEFGQSSPQSDLFGLGCLVYHCVAGRPPFDAAVRFVSHQDDPPPLASVVPGVPADLSRLVRSLMERDPAARPPGAAAVTAVLRRLRRSDEG